MSRITRYIFSQLAIATVLVSIALTFVVWLTQSLQFLQFIINKGLSVSAWLKLTLLLLPSFLLTVLPSALFFVVLFIYNKLTVDRELVVVQAAGVSRMGLALPALLSATGAALAGYALSLFIVPESMKAFKEVQWVMRSDVSSIFLRDGAFNQLSPGLTIYVRGRGNSGELVGVLVHDTRAKDKAVTLMAEHGVIANGDAGPRMMLSNGSRQELTHGTGNLSLLYFDSYALEIGGLDDRPADRYEDNRERSIFELLRATPEDAGSAVNAGRMRAEGHQRLVGPLDAFSYTFVAMAFLLAGTFERRGQLKRIAAAVAAAVVFQAAVLGAQNLASKGSLFILLMYVVVALPVAAGIYMIASPEWRLRRRIVLPGAGAA